MGRNLLLSLVMPFKWIDFAAKIEPPQLQKPKHKCTKARFSPRRLESPSRSQETERRLFAYVLTWSPPGRQTWPDEGTCSQAKEGSLLRFPSVTNSHTHRSLLENNDSQLKPTSRQWQDAEPPPWLWSCFQARKVRVFKFTETCSGLKKQFKLWILDPRKVNTSLHFFIFFF